MKAFFKPARIAFYVLMFVTFFFAGLYIAWLTDAGKYQGLAAGAIVLGWGVMFGGIALISSFFLAAIIPHRLLVRINWVILGLIIIFYGITHYRYIRRQNSTNQGVAESHLAKTAALVKSNSHKSTHSQQKKNIGIGFFIPDIQEGTVLYFYEGVNHEKSQLEHSPSDSVVFILDQYGNFSTSYAPPWLYPEHLKLDYGILHFESPGIGESFVKVVTNKVTGRTSFLDKEAGQFLSWPEFLLTVNSVEFIDKENQSVRIKPSDNASNANTNFELMEPLFIEGEWMRTKLLTEDRKEVGTGWIRWKKNNQLLIKYYLLS